MKYRSNAKYHNKKIVVDSRTFDSKKEANRFQELTMLLKAGQITQLECQVPFELIPAQRVNGKVVERSCKYVADFTYYRDGVFHVEDVKSKHTRGLPDYTIKRKLMLYIHGIMIKEVL